MVRHPPKVVAIRTLVATEPGGNDSPNEDRAFLNHHTITVLDGATTRTETGCVHGVPWFVDRLGTAILEYAEEELSHTLACAIDITAKHHADTCDLSHAGTPSAAVAILRFSAEHLEYLILGDVTVIVDTHRGLDILTDERVRKVALTERGAADLHPIGSEEKARALVHMKHAELSARNVPGGFWFAAADGVVTDYALTGRWRLSEVVDAMILTDGAARLVDAFGLKTWSEVVEMVRTFGPSELVRQVRAAEADDPAGCRWPRNKASDDATVVHVQRAPNVGER